MSSALIGHTGFVGGNLQRQYSFDDCYNSSNIESIAGRSYDMLVCAGAPGVKWKANQDPGGDWASIHRLMTSLSRVEANHVVLISTVDVYPVPIAVDEDTPIDETAGSAYGRHRLQLERFARNRFPTTVIRLPGLFGRGLKKNIIYDLINNNAIDNICPESVYQFYSLDNLWPDVCRIRAAGFALVNLATEGISVRQLAREAFGREISTYKTLAPAHYDFRSKFSEPLGGAHGYLYDKDQVLSSVKSFLTTAGAAPR